MRRTSRPIPSPIPVTQSANFAEGNVSSKVLPSEADCERTGKMELVWMFAIEYPVAIETRICVGPVELSICEYVNEPLLKVKVEV